MLSINYSLSNTLTNIKDTTFSPFSSPNPPSSSTLKRDYLCLTNPLQFPKTPPFSLYYIPSRKHHLFLSKASGSDSETEPVATEEDEWLSKLPDKKKPLYAHSLPCIEAWLRSLGFYQSNDDRAVWFIEKSDWHAQLSLDMTDLYIRYLKSGPGNLEKDVERRFSYALSREDIENAVLGGP